MCHHQAASLHRHLISHRVYFRQSIGQVHPGPAAVAGVSCLSPGDVAPLPGQSIISTSAANLPVDLSRVVFTSHHIGTPFSIP